MSKNIIYGLIDPITNQLRYIGQSSIGLRRPKKHCWSYYLRPERKDGQYSYKQRWILKLMKLNLKPEIIVLESLDSKDQLDESEIFYIQYFKSIGCRLTNISQGGKLSIPPPPRPKGYKHSKETCLLISKVLKSNKRVLTLAQRQHFRNLRLGNKMGPCSQETKDKIRIANTGKKATDSQKLNQSEAKHRFKIKIKDQFGNIYESISDAVRRTGAFKVAIRMHLKGMINRNCKGYVFTKV